MGKEIIVFFAFKADGNGFLSIAGVKVNSHSLEEASLFACNSIGRIDDQESPKFREISKHVYEMLDEKIWIGHGINQLDAQLLNKSFERIGKTPPKAKSIIDTCDFLSYRKELTLLAASLGLGNECNPSFQVCFQNIEAIKLFKEALALYEPGTLKKYVDGDFHPMISYLRDVTGPLSEVNNKREKEVATYTAD